MIRLRVLGSVHLHAPDGRDLGRILAQPKRLALLCYLAVHGGEFHRRDTLLALFWPELDESRARGALNQAVRFLRRELGSSGHDVLLSRGADEVGIDAAKVWCDAAAFRDLIDRGRYDEALALYRGDLLEGFFADDADGFQEWVDRERRRLRVAAESAARKLTATRSSAGDHDAALAAAERAVDLADGDERSVRGLLRLLVRLGDRAAAYRVYDALAKRLAGEFGAQPDPETRAVMSSLRATEPGDAPSVETRHVESESPPLAARAVGQMEIQPLPPPRRRLKRVAVVLFAVGTLGVAAWNIELGTAPSLFARHRFAHAQRGFRQRTRRRIRGGVDTGGVAPDVGRRGEP